MANVTETDDSDCYDSNQLPFENHKTSPRIAKLVDDIDLFQLKIPQDQEAEPLNEEAIRDFIVNNSQMDNQLHLAKLKQKNLKKIRLEDEKLKHYLQQIKVNCAKRLQDRLEWMQNERLRETGRWWQRNSWK